MATAKEHAIDLYMGAIRDGDAKAALDRNIGARYTQHSTGVKDGKEGFLEFFEPFLERNPNRKMEVVRALQDGNKVFLHVFQDLGEAKWVTTDFFDSDAEGKIIEHWDVIAEFCPENPAGRSNIDGVTEITDLDKTDENRALVTDFVNRFLIGRQLDIIDQFIDADNYIQHNIEVGDGLAPFMEHFSIEPCPLVYEELFMIVAEGNFVATLNRANWDGAPLCQVDIFRIENGKIVEHWDAVETVLPKEEWANSGKF